MVGGHSIDDDTLKFGLSVTGFVHPEKIWTNAKAKAGDQLILIKPIGTGAATAALKRGVVTEDQISDVLKSMAQLNSIQDLISTDESDAIHAATDLTGFGLAGHAMQMAQASGVSMKFQFSKLPLFSQTLAFLKEGYITKAHRTNREYAAEHIDLMQLSDLEALCLFDPQTSGGLFLSVAPEHSNSILIKLRARFPAAEIIGEVQAASTKTLFFYK